MSRISFIRVMFHFFLGGGDNNNLIGGRIAPEERPSPHPLNKFYARAEYLIIAKVKCFGLCPYAPYVSFFRQGQKHIISNSSGECLEGGAYAPHDLIRQRHIPLMPHGSTRLWLLVFIPFSYSFCSKKKKNI